LRRDKEIAMSKRLLTVVMVSLTFGGAAAWAQSPPDFSGMWRLDPSKSVTSGGPVRVGGPGRAATRGQWGTITQPTKIKHVNPRYPVDAQKARIAGVVVIEAEIGPNGKVQDATVLRSIPLLDQAALDAVTQWEFTPFLLNDNVPVAGLMTVTVSFSLSGVTPVQGIPPLQSVVIQQDSTRLTVTRATTAGDFVVTYNLDGTESRLTTRGRGGAPGGSLTSKSQWEGTRLVSSITSPGPLGAVRTDTESRWLEGDAMIVELKRPSPEGTDPFVRKEIWTRVRD
jgi:TonB family protein